MTVNIGASDKVKAIIRSVLESRFGDIEIHDIMIRAEEDDGGDRILFVKVILEGKPRILDPKETIGMPRRLIPLIEDAGETGFPVMSYIAKSELESLKAGAS